MSAHTPGPWFVSCSALVDRALDFAIYVEIDGKRHIIAEAYGRSDWQHEHPSEANARLMASSPDLLLALRRLVTRCDAELADPEDVDDVQFAKAMIARATQP